MSINNERLMSISSYSGVDKLEDIVQGYKRYQVLNAAIKLGLFQYLEEKELANGEEICEALGVNGMFRRSFLQALIDMGMLEQQGDNYKNSRISSILLLEDSPNYQGDWFKTSGAGSSSWTDLTDTLTQTEPKPDNYNAGPGRDFIKSLAQRSIRGELQEVVKAVSNWNGFKDAKSLIDIGGGHGLYAIALCQENENINAAVLDKPFVTEYTKDFIDKFGMESRIKTISGDITSDDLVGEYDVVIISHLLYKFRKDLPSIFNKVYKCLKPGGLFVSNHWFCAPGCAAESNGVSELDKSLHSFGHPLCHIETFGDTLKEAGFSVIESKDIPSTFGCSKLHLAVKDIYTEAENHIECSCGCCQ